MSEYYSYYGQAKDPTTRYQVKSGRIETYQMNSVFMSQFKRGPLTNTFAIDASTEIVEENIDPNGKGSVKVRNSTKEYEFFIFENAHQFAAEIKSQIG